MPFFGVDDVLLLLASTTAVLWAKRTDIIQAGVYRAVSLMTHSPASASKYANEAARNHHGPPLLLLRGFDLQTARRSAGAVDFLKSLPTLASDGLKLSRMSDGEPREDLMRSSLVSEYSECPTTYKVPDIPHRRYNSHRKSPQVTALADSTEEEVAESIRKYSVAAVHSLFAKMESEANWEAVIRVSRGIDRAHLRLKYLTKQNVEAALRVLITCATSTSPPTASPDLPLAYYFTFAEDMLLEDSILIALFDLCRYSEVASIQLYERLLPFQAEWSPAVYACSLTTISRFDYKKALQLHKEYLQAQSRNEWGSYPLLHPIKQAVASTSLAEEGESLPLREEAGIVKLQYLYHIIVPLVVAREPARAGQFIADMLANDPGSAPDVFLKCLANHTGQGFAEAYLKEALRQGSDLDSTLWPLNNSSEVDPFQMKWDQCGLAYALYALKPSSMNLNSLLKVVLSTGAMEKEPTSGSLSQPRPAGDWERVFESVPLTSSQDALILARSITEHPDSHALAELFLNAMVRRKHFSVVPILAFYIAGQGRWATALRGMTIYLSNRRGRVSTEEIGLCVEAAVHTERWNSVLFWVERAHAKGLRLPIGVYDIALSASTHWTWQTTLQVVRDMRAVNGVCSNEGLLNLLQATTKQGATAEVLRELSGASGTHWSL